MKVIRASHAGFCMGVSLALKKLEQAIKNYGTQGPSICTFGPIIHNPQVLKHFENQGVRCVTNISDTGPNDWLLIRAHGIPQQEESALRSSCAYVEDATCPKVKKAQMGIAEATQNKTLLLFGEAEHPEVRGLISYAGGEAYVFATVEELRNLPLDPHKPYALASQTTQDKAVFEELASCLATRLPQLTILDTICNATRERQDETRRIATNVDLMVVVGGKNSGNTRRLAELAAHSCKRSHHIESITEIDHSWFAGCSTVGLCAGASTPKAIIDEIESYLNSLA